MTKQFRNLFDLRGIVGGVFTHGMELTWGNFALNGAIEPLKLLVLTQPETTFCEPKFRLTAIMYLFMDHPVIAIQLHSTHFFYFMTSSLASFFVHVALALNHSPAFR